jgi:type III secretory pathway component EscU
MLAPRKTESGVCIVRVEVQKEHLLITVTINRDLARSLYTAGEQHFTDSSDALEAVAEFLRSFSRAIGA